MHHPELMSMLKKRLKYFFRLLVMVLLIRPHRRSYERDKLRRECGLDD